MGFAGHGLFWSFARLGLDWPCAWVAIGCAGTGRVCDVLGIGGI